MHDKKVISAGKPLAEASKALIMLHGRGANANDILQMAAYLNVNEFALLAPEATNNTWYPYSFMSPLLHNEPWVTSALALVQNIVNDIEKAGIAKSDIYFMGFSQGACLTLEYVTRNAAKYGGVAAFTGGLIGAEIDSINYSGNFDQTPIFIGTSNPDPHVPVGRVYETETILKQMNGNVRVKVYPGMGHMINQNELDSANAWVFGE